MKPATLLVVSLLLSAVAAPAFAHIERVPRLDVERSCRDAKIYGMLDPEQTYKNCMLDEMQAKKQLEKKWSHFKKATRRSCLAAGARPSPSYVELLTCIEMTEQSLKPPSARDLGIGAVPGGALGSPSPRPALAPGPRAMPR